MNLFCLMSLSGYEPEMTSGKSEENDDWTQVYTDPKCCILLKKKVQEEAVQWGRGGHSI